MGRTFVLPFSSHCLGWLLRGSSASRGKSSQGLGRLAKLEPLQRATCRAKKSEPGGLDDSQPTARYMRLGHRRYRDDVRWVRVCVWVWVARVLGLLGHLCRLRTVVRLHLYKLTAVLAFLLQLCIELLDHALVAGCFSQLQKGCFFPVDDFGGDHICERVQDTRHARRATATSRHARDEKDHRTVDDSTLFGPFLVRGRPSFVGCSFAALGWDQSNDRDRSCRFGAAHVAELGCLGLASNGGCCSGFGARFHLLGWWRFCLQRWKHPHDQAAQANNCQYINPSHSCVSLKKNRKEREEAVNSDA